MQFDAEKLWTFLLWGYCFTVLIELPILVVGLSARHSLRRRIVAGFWLTACTYPIVVLVLPILIGNPYGRVVYLFVAETFAPAAECGLFWLAFGREEGITRRESIRDMAAIIAANVASFAVGEFAYAWARP